MLTSLEAPEEGTDPDQQQYVYTYQELPAAGGQTVSDYMARLLEEDSDVQVVDAAGGTADPPDFAAAEGSLWLAKPSAQEGSRLSLRLDWTGSGCTVTVARPQGAVEAPEPDPMTNDDAVRYIQSLSPSLLGLDGSSMGKYEIYPVEGAVLVDHTPCLRLQVYYRDPEAETNRVVGIYLLTGDRQHLYKLDQDRSHVSELT